MNDRHNPCLNGDAPYGSRAWEKLYARRTANERVFAEIKDHTGLKHCRHRRRYLWLGRLFFAAILRHVKAWLKHPSEGGTSPT